VEIIKSDGVFYDYVIVSKYGPMIDIKETPEGIVVRPRNSNPCLYQGTSKNNKQTIIFSDPSPKSTWKEFRSLDNQW
jgi:hypothetical protein